MTSTENVMVMNSINSYSSIISNKHIINNTLRQLDETIKTVDNDYNVHLLLYNLRILKKKMLILHGLYLYDDTQPNN